MPLADEVVILKKLFWKALHEGKNKDATIFIHSHFNDVYAQPCDGEGL